MTRMIKYAQKRRIIELENTLFYMSNPSEWWFLMKFQKEIKKEMGCKH